MHKNRNNLRIKEIEEAYIPSDDPEVEYVLREMRHIFRATNFLDSANKSYDINDYSDMVNKIDVQLSECSHTEISKIQHFINEIHNIKSIISSRPNMESSGVLRDIDCICNKYRTITEGGQI